MGHRITILTDADGWMEDRLPALLHDLQSCGHVVRLVAAADIDEGDFLFWLHPSPPA
ncbi:MAG: hypothetical protein U0031_13315 [Thermomicrobiales bacterium]